MKKLFSLLLCVVMVLSLVACGSKTDDTQTPDEPQDTAPELSGTMKVVATGDVYGPLFDAFTADTGVEVECLSMSSGEVLSKLRAEGGTPSADLWFGGGIDAFMSAKDDGLLEPVTFDAAASSARVQGYRGLLVFQGHHHCRLPAQQLSHGGAGSDRSRELG